MADHLKVSMRDRYQKYKKGTDIIVDWLANTASTFQGNTATTTTCYTAKSTGNRNQAESQSILLKARDLVGLAETIKKAHTAQKSPTGAISLSIIELLLEVIEFRSTCAAWYESQTTTAAVAEANKRHQFFILVLQKVHDLLEPLKEKGEEAPVGKKQKKGKAKDTPGTFSKLDNLFSCLEIEDPRYKYKLEDDHEDASFALYCHLQDLQDAREIVKQSWIEYAKGTISLFAACMTTDTAFALSRLADEKFVAAYPAFQDWWHLPGFLSFQIAEHGKVVYLFPNDKTVASSAYKTASNPADLLCPAAALILREVERLQNSFQASPQGVHFMLLNRDVWDFGSVLLQQTEQLKVFVQQETKRRGEDKQKQRGQKSDIACFVEGLIGYCVHGKLPILLVSACQAYYEVYAVIGSDPACASEAYLDGVDHRYAIMEDFGRRCASKGREMREKGTVDAKKKRQSMGVGMRISAEYLDVAKTVTTSHGSQQIGRPRLADLGTPLQTLAALPCTAGKLLYEALCRFHETSIRPCNHSVVVLAMAHLYSAARKYDLLPDWTDMETILASHRHVQPLVTKSNKKADAYIHIRHYLLALGVPLSNLTGKVLGPVPGLKTVEKTSRQVMVTSEFMRTSIEFQDRSSKLGLRRDNLIETVLLKIVAGAKSTEEISKKKSGSTAGVKQYTLSRLLQTFKTTFMSDEKYLHFDYFGFVTFTEEVLDEIARVLGCSSGPKSSPYHELVYHILADAAEAAALSKPVASTMIGRAAATLKSAIEEGGNHYTQAALRQSNGHIPKDKWPKLRTQDIDPIVPDVLQTVAQERGLRINVGPSHTSFYDPEGSKMKFEELKTEIDRKVQERQHPSLFRRGGEFDDKSALPELSIGGKVWKDAPDTNGASWTKREHLSDHRPEDEGVNKSLEEHFKTVMKMMGHLSEEELLRLARQEGLI